MGNPATPTKLGLQIRMDLVSSTRPNFAFKWPAGRSPRPGLKPLFSPETNGVGPLADRARRLPR